MVCCENQGVMTESHAVLGISTSRHYSIKSLNYQNISSDFNYSDFSNYFFKNFNFGLNKPLLHFLSDDRTKTDKNYTKKIDILCEKRVCYSAKSKS